MFDDDGTVFADMAFQIEMRDYYEGYCESCCLKGECEAECEDGKG